MRMMRTFFGFCLALLLALTSVTMAEARHYGPAGASMVICSNGVAQTITLDANGRKLPFTHNCPDCIGVTLDVPAVIALPQRPDFSRKIVVALPHAARVQAIWRHADARGPPVLM